MHNEKLKLIKHFQKYTKYIHILSNGDENRKEIISCLQTT